ncbi:unnamed protein product [Phyllotreta striolata]|uniref:Arrestin C-terminal-like domain-containing protein n=1 Tax=Phyllotreta striolata TaxID=444603 RepID=A0A9N9TRJ6_PHYSR|nr:unnamed protein product [Phyllotreta striolata]
MPECRIILDTPGVISAGGIITGKVICNFSSDVPIREIRCNFKGKEKTRIRRGKHTYFGKNVLVDQTQIVAEEGTVPKGIYEFNFTFDVPRQIPSSFSGKSGWVFYYVKAIVDRPLMIDYKHKITLEMSSPLDFNMMREKLQLTPVVYEKDKTLCCCCCASEPITMSLHLEKEAFVVGETARIVVEIVNMSNTNVEELEVSLTRIIECFSEKKGMRSEKVKDVLGVERGSGIGAHGRGTYRINFLIPPTIEVHNFDNCQLIKEQFRFTAEAMLPDIHRNFSTYAVVTLGHIPLTNAQNVPPEYLGIQVHDAERLPHVSDNSCVIV